MYSLGILLYELFNYFSTEMERRSKLSSLNTGILPDDWDQWARRNPEIANIVR